VQVETKTRKQTNAETLDFFSVLVFLSVLVFFFQAPWLTSSLPLSFFFIFFYFSPCLHMTLFLAPFLPLFIPLFINLPPPYLNPKSNLMSWLLCGLAPPPPPLAPPPHPMSTHHAALFPTTTSPPPFFFLEKSRHAAVFLMDQSKTSGIGNYILSEVLFFFFDNVSCATKRHWTV
jgi:hypothetical protein